jgi:hypothetical protein
MSYGEFETGNLNLCEVPLNLSKEQDKEQEIIRAFWEREMEKCQYVKKRKLQIQKQIDEKVKQEAIRRAEEEKHKDKNEEQEREEMELENEKYIDMLYMTKAKLGMMSQDEVDEILKKRAKKK